VFVDLSALTPRERYKFLLPVIAPRPIAFVSTLGPSGTGNLAPFSYFTMGGSSPQSLVFCPLLNSNSERKDTLRNIEATEEFVVNIVTRAMAEGVNQASFAYGYGTDEFDAAGFTRAPSTMVKPPRVLESPVNMECRLFRIVRHGEGPLASNYVIGEVVAVHVDDAVLVNGIPDIRRIAPVTRLGGDDWGELTPESIFTLVRPR
jgi:flavin reductase (DIM6/NTAB) family NADH-FMN oxidoreductase RutF